MPNLITAGGASDPLAITAASDGALTFQTGPSGAKVNALAFASDGTPTFLKGRLLAQVQTYTTSALASGTTTLPCDDTIPQITEGDEYLSLAFTPTNVNSTLEIDVTMAASNGGAGQTAIALFQVGTAGALAAVINYASTADSLYTTTFKHSMTAGTTSSLTFKVRAGNNGGAITYRMNGTSGGRLLGGVSSSRITIKEYLP